LLLTPKGPTRPPVTESSEPRPSLSSPHPHGTTVAHQRRWRRAMLWVVVAAVAGLALAIGSGAFTAARSKPPTLYQRTLEVAGQYRCPVCASESAAVSDAAEAIEIRSLIQGWLKQGDSQAQIRDYLVSDYGSSILEKPPASGLDTLVWVLPAVAAAFGIAGLAFGFARWRRASAAGQLLLVDGPAIGPDLEARTDLQVRTDLEARVDVGAGDDMGSGHQVLQLDDQPAPEPVQERLFAVGDDEQPRSDLDEATVPARPLYRRVAPIVGAVLILVAGALWLVDRSSGQRLPGGTVSGGVTGIEEELQQAASLASSDPAAALAVYDEVLASDPDQPVALSAAGWIYAAAGYVAKGEGLLQKAEADDPSYDAPHLYSGLVLLEDQRKPAAAVKELKWYLAHGPDPTMAQTAKTALARAQASL
jgi:cytochrome c-type biogenesis protein CcmH